MHALNGSVAQVEARWAGLYLGPAETAEARRDPSAVMPDVLNALSPLQALYPLHEVGPIQRLGGEVVHAGLAGLLHVLAHDSRRSGDDANRCAGRMPADGLRRLQATHARHLEIHEHGGVRRPLISGLAEQVDRRRSIGRQAHLCAGPQQQFLGHDAVDAVVIDNQKPFALQALRRCNGVTVWVGRNR